MVKKEGTLNRTYKNWLNSTDSKLKPKLIDSLNKAGIPLEYKTKRRLENLGFEANPYYYEPTKYSPFDSSHSDTHPRNELKRRELDLVAVYRRGWIIQTKGVDLHLKFKLAVECKYSSDKDFFVFEHQDPLISLPNFPVKLNGQKIFTTMWLYNYFDIPLKIEKVTEVDVSNLGKRERDNFNDKITHNASEQLFSAISHIITDRHMERNRIYYPIVKDMDIRKKFQKMDGEGKLRRVQEIASSYIPDEELDDFCEKNITHFDFEKIGSYNIELLFPMIVIDDSRGVIKVILNEKNEIIDFTDAGYVVYKYVSEKVHQQDTFGSPKLDKEMPIIICNLSYLEECISKLINGMGEIKEHVEDKLSITPHYLVNEIMFNL